MGKSNRRKFIASTALIAGASVTDSFAAEPIERKFIAHQVYFWLKNPDSTQEREQLITGIKTLKKIASVHKLTIGVVAATEKRPVIDDTWGVSELALFRDLAGQAAYQTDPIHLEFVKNYSHLWSKVIIYDSSEV